jgi:hypothetical protein
MWNLTFFDAMLLNVKRENLFFFSLHTRHIKPARSMKRKLKIKPIYECGVMYDYKLRLMSLSVFDSST